MTIHLASMKWPLSVLLVPAAILAPAPVLRADAPDEDTYAGESPERYAQVKVLEGDVRIHKGDGEEVLSQGIPVAEGDVVESSGRGVLQLGDGSRIAFGGATRFTVAALFTDKDGQRQALLRVDYGRIRVNLGPQSDARIRVDTPSGTGTIAERASVTFEVERDRSVRVKVISGRASFANETDRVALRGGERLTVYTAQDRLDRVREFNTYDSDAFDEWADSRLTVRRSASWEHVPSDIRYYSDDLDDRGDWKDVENVGWCWFPRVSVEWRPYWQGRWGCYAGGMTWVSDEPWGYVTYHHGRWGWGAGLGWYWIPGASYAPAWVAWHSDDAYFGWAPLGYYNEPCVWGYGAWGGGFCWNIVDFGYINAHHIHRHIHHDPIIVHRFPRQPGITGTVGNRPLTPPWRRGPAIIARTEFQRPNPAQFQRALSREVVRERLQTYERQSQATTGRVILRREPRTPVASPNARPTTEARTEPRIPFEDRTRTRPSAERPVLRDRPRTDVVTSPGVERPHADSTQRRPTETPQGERRPDILRERTREERPREETRPNVVREERRPEPTRETPRTEHRPEPTRETPRTEHRPEPTRETPRTEHRPEPTRETPRTEHRPEPTRESPRTENRSEPARESHSSSPSPSRSESPSSSRSESPRGPRR